MNLWLVAQIVGVAAVLVSLSIFQVNKRSSMIWLGLAAGTLFMVHFYLLHAYTGAILNLIAIGRSYTFVKVKPSRKNSWILIFFLSVAGLATFATWEGPLSLIALLGTMASGITFWQRKPKTIRRWALTSPPLWFTYNAISQSYPGMFIEIVNLFSVLIGTYRFDAKHKSHLRHHLIRPA